MARIDRRDKKIQAKLVYYGPGMCGKTTNLEYVNSKLATQQLMSLATEGDRTIFFDFMPLELGKLWDMDVSFKLYTVPGQVRYNQTRKMVLKNVDGVVFVADSQRSMLDANLESLDNLYANLRELGIDHRNIAIILQYNKRDLPNVMSREELDKALNPGGYPTFLASAMIGEGVTETLKASCAEVLRRLRQSMGGGDEARKTTSTTNTNMQAVQGAQAAPGAAPASPAAASKASKATPAGPPLRSPSAVTAAAPAAPSAPSRPQVQQAAVASAQAGAAAAEAPAMVAPRMASAVAASASSGTASQLSAKVSSPAARAAAAPKAVAAAPERMATPKQWDVAVTTRPPMVVGAEQAAAAVALEDGPSGRAEPAEAASSSSAADRTDGVRHESHVEPLAPTRLDVLEDKLGALLAAMSKALDEAAQSRKTLQLEMQQLQQAVATGMAATRTRSQELEIAGMAELEEMQEQVTAVASSVKTLQTSLLAEDGEIQMLRKGVMQLVKVVQSQADAPRSAGGPADAVGLAELRKQVAALPTKADLEALQKQLGSRPAQSGRLDDLDKDARFDALQRQISALPSKADLEQLAKQVPVRGGASGAGPSGPELGAISSRLGELPTKAELKAVVERVAELPTKAELKAVADRMAELPTKTELEAAGKPRADVPSKAELKALVDRVAELPTKAELKALVDRVAELPTKAELTKLSTSAGAAAPGAEELASLHGKLAALQAAFEKLPVKAELEAWSQSLTATLHGRSAPPAPPASAVVDTRARAAVVAEAKAAAPEKVAEPEPKPEPKPAPASEPAAEAPQTAAPAPEAAVPAAAEPPAATEAPAEAPEDAEKPASVKPAEAIAAPKDEAPATAKDEAPAAAASPEAASAEQPAAGAVDDKADDPEHRNAARAARVMVSDLLLYQKDSVDEGIKQGDFLERNKEALADMRTTYETRIPKHVRDHKDYLAEAIDAFIAKRKQRLGL